MNLKLQKYFFPLFVFNTLTSLYWIFYHTSFSKILSLYLGSLVGALLLDVDHFLYWLLLHRETPESQLVKATIRRHDFKSLLKIFSLQKENHNNLVFHHFSFHLLLVIVSFFLFTSSNSIFAKSCLFALNWHLLSDIYTDWTQNPQKLQTWLFARMETQLSLKNIQKYIRLNIIFIAIFGYLLLRS